MSPQEEMLLHDLSNPLTAALLTFEEVRAQVVPLATNQEIRISLAALEHSLATMRQYVENARQAERPGSSSHHFQLKTCLQRVRLVCSPLAQQAGVKLVTAGEWSVSTTGSSLSLIRVLNNLVRNSIEAHQSKLTTLNPAIELRCRPTNHFVSLTIKDNGPGIPPAVLRLVSFRSLSQKGSTGLGLVNARQVIEQEFGGQLKITSHLDRGTVITIRLPLQAQRTAVYNKPRRQL